MPRRRPSRLRRQAERLPAPALSVATIPYLSVRAARLLALAEHVAGAPRGWVADLLMAWSRITREPGYPLCLPVPACTCPWCDPLGARRDLADLLAELPRRERALIKVPLARIDRWFASRTLPDPHSRSGYWFERRLMEQEGWGRDDRA